MRSESQRPTWRGRWPLELGWVCDLVSCISTACRLETTFVTLFDNKEESHLNAERESVDSNRFPLLESIEGNTLNISLFKSK